MLYKELDVAEHTQWTLGGDLIQKAEVSGSHFGNGPP